jgi:uncharacterized protein YkwD
MKRKLLLVAIIVASTYVGAVIGYNLKQSVEATPVSTGPITTVQKPDIYGLWVATNKERSDRGIAPLALNDSLNKSAATKCVDMDAKNYWSHDAPDGTTPWSMIRETYGGFSEAGENLALNSNTNADVISRWMNSKGHRANILKKDYTDVGYAICSVTNVDSIPSAYLVVQHFAAK